MVFAFLAIIFTLIIYLFFYAFAIFLPISAVWKKIEKKNNLAILVYNKCKENNITNFKSKQNKDKLEILASSCHLSDISEIEKLFNKGKTILIERKKAEELKIIKHYRNKEINEYKENKKLSEIIGKQKYLLEYIYCEKDNYCPTIRYKNEVYRYPTKINHNLDQKLCDCKNIEEKAKLIKISNIKLEKTEGFNIKVNAKIKVKENITILNYKAILDGTFKAIIYNQDYYKIGQGYFSAPGFGAEKHYITNIGFNHITEMDFMCYINYPNDLEDNIETYICEIEPVNLWLMEDFI